jgi:hypothetical protein
LSNLEKYRAGLPVTLLDKAASCQSYAELKGFTDQCVKDGRGTEKEHAKMAEWKIKLQQAES